MRRCSVYAGRATESSCWPEYVDDPEGFAREVLGVELYDLQVEIAMALIEHQRVAVASCFGAGKTFLAAVLVVWWLCTREQAFVVTTAPTGRQVKTLLWREIRKLWAKAKRRLPGRPLQLQWVIEADRQALGFSANNPTGAQGFHERNTLVIEDEAAGIDADLSKTLEGAMVSPDCRRLKIGNPENLEGPFYEAFAGKAADSWHHFQISAFDTPNVKAGKIVVHGMVTREWVEDQRREFGEDSNWWRTKVLGQFPADTIERLIPMEWIKAAQARWSELEDGTPRVLGADIARGGDKTALAKRFGRRVHMGRAWQEPDTMQAVAEIVHAIDSDGFEQANIDETAVGGGVVDRVREKQREREEAAGRDDPLVRCKIRGCNFSSKARKAKKFHRLMDELWWEVRHALNPNLELNPEPIALPPDEELAQQLNCRTYQTVGGVIKVETKNELKKRKVKSPDKADAVALCIYRPKEIAIL